MNMEKWVEKVLSFIASAFAVGFIVTAACVTIILANESPDTFGILGAAGILAFAYYVKQPTEQKIMYIVGDFNGLPEDVLLRLGKLIDKAGQINDPR